MKWLYTFHMHTNSISVWQTDQYPGSKGYPTEKDATLAGLKALSEAIGKHGETIKNRSKDMVELLAETEKLNQRMVELQREA